LPSSGSMTPRSTDSTSSGVGSCWATGAFYRSAPVKTRRQRYTAGVTGPDTPRLSAPRLAVLKALGDNTRYAIYLELARSPRPLATAEIAETLDLHTNTVPPHLERLSAA